MMSLTSLVSDLLEEGDELWLEVDGERVEGVYRDHVIENDEPRIQLENGSSYRLGDRVGDAEDFGLKGESSLYEPLKDYGLDGEKIQDMAVEAASIAYELGYIDQDSKQKIRAD